MYRDGGAERREEEYPSRQRQGYVEGPPRSYQEDRRPHGAGAMGGGPPGSGRGMEAHTAGGHGPNQLAGMSGGMRDGHYHQRDRAQQPYQRRDEDTGDVYTNAKKVYVGGLSRRLSEVEVREAFEKMGRIVSFEYKGDFAFVEYGKAEDANYVIEGGDVRYRRTVTEEQPSGAFRLVVIGIPNDTVALELQRWAISKGTEGLVHCSVYQRHSQREGLLEFDRQLDYETAQRLLDGNTIFGNKVSVRDEHEWVRQKRELGPLNSQRRFRDRPRVDGAQGPSPGFSGPGGFREANGHRYHNNGYGGGGGYNNNTNGNHNGYHNNRYNNRDDYRRRDYGPPRGDGGRYNRRRSPPPHSRRFDQRGAAIGGPGGGGGRFDDRGVRPPPAPLPPPPAMPGSEGPTDGPGAHHHHYRDGQHPRERDHHPHQHEPLPPPPNHHDYRAPVEAGGSGADRFGRDERRAREAPYQHNHHDRPRSYDRHSALPPPPSLPPGSSSNGGSGGSYDEYSRGRRRERDPPPSLPNEMDKRSPQVIRDFQDDAPSVREDEKEFYAATGRSSSYNNNGHVMTEEDRRYQQRRERFAGAGNPVAPPPPPPPRRREWSRSRSRDRRRQPHSAVGGSSYHSHRGDGLSGSAHEYRDHDQQNYHYQQQQNHHHRRQTQHQEYHADRRDVGGSRDDRYYDDGSAPAPSRGDAPYDPHAAAATVYQQPSAEVAGVSPNHSQGSQPIDHADAAHPTESADDRQSVCSIPERTAVSPRGSDSQGLAGTDDRGEYPVSPADQEFPPE